MRCGGSGEEGCIEGGGCWIVGGGCGMAGGGCGMTVVATGWMFNEGARGDGVGIACGCIDSGVIL